jgi:HD-GYP domain-containing protein (c-di-GMP phosphodiesterase class II)
MPSSTQKLIKNGSGLTGAHLGGDCVNSLSEELAREFDAPIGLIDLKGRCWRLRMGIRSEAFPGAEACLAAAQARGLLENGRVMLWRPETANGDGPIWLGLPVPMGGDCLVLAMIGFASTAGAVDANLWGPPCPERALRAWGQAVANRLRAEAGKVGGLLSTASAERPEVPLFDRLARRLRVSDPPERFQRLAASGLLEELRLGAVAWVPGNPREPVVVAGEMPGLKVEGYRALLPENLEKPIWIVNRPVGPREAGIERLAVVAAADSNAGWFVALNPLDGRPFGLADVNVLQPVAAVVGTQRANARVYGDLKELLFGVIRALSAAIDAKDPYTSGHSERVARIAVRLAEELGMPANKRGDLYLMGLLHDVGKIGIDDGVLKKPGPLTPDEFKLVKSHVQIGVHILSDLKKLHHLLPGVAHHHESLDGTGYPDGLAGENIPLEARILAVADGFDAMSSSRPYRRRLTSAQINDVLVRGSGVQWDPRVVNALYACRADIELIRQKGLGQSLQQVVDDTLGRP